MKKKQDLVCHHANFLTLAVVMGTNEQPKKARLFLKEAKKLERKFPEWEESFQRNRENILKR